MRSRDTQKLIASKWFWIMHLGHVTSTVGGSARYFTISEYVLEKLSVAPFPVLYHDTRTVTIACSFLRSFCNTLNSSTAVILSQDSFMIFKRSFIALNFALAPSPRNLRQAGSSVSVREANASNSSKTMQSKH